MLLKGENETKINEAIAENKDWFEDLFDTIIPWEEQFVAVDKLIWVRCRGLPLKLWNSECFKHIAALLGTLVEIDEATLALEELEYARFKIRVPVGCEAKITSYMKINEVLYQVSVEEECTVPDYKLCQCHWSEESEGMETEVGSIASNASARSGSRDFEDVREVEEENIMAEMRNVQPPPMQGHRRSEPIVSVGGGESISVRPIGPLSAPIFSTIIGKDVLEANSPTALSRAEVDNRFGPSVLAQERLVCATYVEKEGRCRSKNLFEASSKSDPAVYGEEMLWNGSLGRQLISGNFISLNESEQGGLGGKDKITSHYGKARNKATTAPPSKSSEVTKENRRSFPCTVTPEAKGIEDLSSQTSSTAEGNKGGVHVSSKSVSRVEDLLRESQEGKVNESSKLLSPVVVKTKHKQCHFQSDSKSSRIKDTYPPFGKQKKKGTQLIEDEVDQKKQVNNSFTSNSSATMERRVFWVGESSKSSKRDERKNIRLVLSQISNSVSDTAIDNCNRLVWLKHGSLETIRVWELGKQLGASCGEEGKVMVSLEELEKRDRFLKLKREEGEVLGCL